MEKEYVKDMLEDIKSLAQKQDFNGIIAICKNEIEEIDGLTIKQQLVDISKFIEDAKYELAMLRDSVSDDAYKMLNEASLGLRNLIINIKELTHELENQD